MILSKPYRIASLILAPALAVCLACLPALAEPAHQGAQAAPPGPARTAAAPAASGATDTALKQRVEQLEEQLVDMQVVVGTLESLARGGATAAASGTAHSDGGGGGAADVRLDGLETQVRA